MSRSSFTSHVLLTSYEILMSAHDMPLLSRIPWHYLIVDEGHRLKNGACKLNACLRQYSTKHRLLLTGQCSVIQPLWLLSCVGSVLGAMSCKALCGKDQSMVIETHGAVCLGVFTMPCLVTQNECGLKFFWCAGTPVQNKLDELWSLLNFLMPALFSSSEDFQRWFGVDCHLDEEEVLLVTSRLHQILRPFMLRRLKETVACELPSKASKCAGSIFMLHPKHGHHLAVDTWVHDAAAETRPCLPQRRCTSTH